MLTRIRRLVTAAIYRLVSSRYRLIRTSGLFDGAYYLKNNPDVAASGAEPLVHYLKQGFSENRRPGPLFDHNYYFHQASSPGDNVQNPLLHYLGKGREQGFKPNFFVDPDYYRLVNPDYHASTLDPLSHFLQEGDFHNQECSPSPYFDPHFYCKTYADAAHLVNDPGAAYVHWLHSIPEENRQPSVYFDPPCYLDKNPTLTELGLNPFSHYGTFGASERKSPCPLFDPDFYAKTYEISDCDDLFAHFLRNSLQEDRQPCSWFDPAFYRRTYLSGADQPPAALKHFLEVGLSSHHYPNQAVAELVDKPLISIAVPVYNVKISYLNNCIRSVLYQSYPHWELCLMDDCSTDPAIRPLLARWAALDSRIKTGSLAKNSGISAATNGAAKLASGSYLAFLDNDDELAPDALQTFATWINRHPADLYYSDENLIGDDGRQFSVFRKPGFNRELLLCHNYVNHCVLTRKSLYDKVGGCDDKLNGAQDHDLFLRLSEQAETTLHIPRILYHWRASATSTSINHDQKDYANEAGRKSVENALARAGDVAEVAFTDWKFFYRVNRRIEKELSVTLVISWEKHEGDIIDWLTRLLDSAGCKVAQLIIIMSKHPTDALIGAIKRATGIDAVLGIAADQRRSAARLHLVHAEIACDLVAFVSGELDIESPKWLATLVGYGQSPEFGRVGGRVDYPAEFYDSVTTMPDCSSSSPHYYCHFLTNASVFMNGRHCPQQVLSPSGDLFLVNSALLKAEAAIDAAESPYLFTLVDFSLRLHQMGRKNVYTPHCRAKTSSNPLAADSAHSASPALQEEKQRFQNKWSDLLNCGDPFYNPGLISDEGLSVDEFRGWLTGSPL